MSEKQQRFIKMEFKYVGDMMEEIGLTQDEIEYVMKRKTCPFCGKGFLSYPDGWGWIGHLRRHKE